MANERHEEIITKLQNAKEQLGFQNINETWNNFAYYIMLVNSALPLDGDDTIDTNSDVYRETEAFYRSLNPNDPQYTEEELLEMGNDFDRYVRLELFAREVSRAVLLYAMNRVREEIN